MASVKDFTDSLKPKFIPRAEGRLSPSKFHNCFIFWERKEKRWEVTLVLTIISSLKLSTLSCWLWLAHSKFLVNMICLTDHLPADYQLE